MGHERQQVRWPPKFESRQRRWTVGGRQWAWGQQTSGTMEQLGGGGDGGPREAGSDSRRKTERGSRQQRQVMGWLEATTGHKAGRRRQMTNGGRIGDKRLTSMMTPGRGQQTARADDRMRTPTTRLRLSHRSWHVAADLNVWSPSFVAMESLVANFVSLRLF